MSNSSTAEIRNNPSQSRFETHQGGELSVLEYSERPDEIVFLHTEVPDSLQGQGIASQLARVALEYAHSHQLRIVAQCPFVADYLKKHPKFER